jgi:hypothetical protein
MMLIGIRAIPSILRVVYSICSTDSTETVIQASEGMSVPI